MYDDYAKDMKDKKEGEEDGVPAMNALNIAAGVLVHQHHVYGPGWWAGCDAENAYEIAVCQNIFLHTTPASLRLSRVFSFAGVGRRARA